MDTSETYIKMCEKADEIQEGWKRSYGDYYLWKYRTGKYSRYHINPCLYDIPGYHPKSRQNIWLPRQDQLQTASGLSWQEFDKECLKYEADTKEQAGIQVVMQEKFHKAWNGEGWI